MTFQIYIPFEDSGYNNGVMIEEKDEQYRLTAALGPKGQYTAKIRFCYPQKWENKKSFPGDKAIPMSMNFGNRGAFLRTLQRIIDAVTNQYRDADKKSVGETVDDDIPF